MDDVENEIWPKTGMDVSKLNLPTELRQPVSRKLSNIITEYDKLLMFLSDFKYQKAVDSRTKVNKIIEEAAKDPKIETALSEIKDGIDWELIDAHLEKCEFFCNKLQDTEHELQKFQKKLDKLVSEHDVRQRQVFYLYELDSEISDSMQGFEEKTEYEDLFLFTE